MSAREIIIDTNLLLLLVIGAIEQGRHIRSSSRLNAFSEVDYQTVLEVIEHYEAVCITPYIATEVSNLIDLKGHAKTLAMEAAKEIFKQFRPIKTDIQEDCDTAYFSRYGITDASLIKLVPDYVVLTNDTRLLEPLYLASNDNVLPYEALRRIRGKG